MDERFEVASPNALPHLVDRTYLGIGNWWPGEHEGDVIGLGDDGTLVVDECKYTSDPMTIGIWKGFSVRSERYAGLHLTGATQSTPSAASAGPDIRIVSSILRPVGTKSSYFSISGTSLRH